jgi:hypothetical protein
MGIHRNKYGVKTLKFLMDFGRVLGYSVKPEESMFTGNPNSPDLDLTWRFNEHAKYPLFIFEVESSSTKSASDNALKVFSRKTSVFEKPLFFFHIFLDNSIGSSRIEYLKENYDKLNYDNYLLSKPNDVFRLIRDILDQTMRLATYFDLFSTIEILKSQNVFSLALKDILNLLVDRGYDRLPESNFLPIIERLIIEKRYDDIYDFYTAYIKNYLSQTQFSFDYNHIGSYGNYYSRDFLRVLHYGIFLISDEEKKLQNIFGDISKIEHCFGTQISWKPGPLLSGGEAFHLSHSPILLTLLCLGFSSSPYATHFSEILKYILKDKTEGFSHFNVHGLIWLLIASRLSKDPKSYEFARSLINENGGIPISWITEVTTDLYESYERFFDDARYDENDVCIDTDCVDIVSYDEWDSWLSPYNLSVCLYELKYQDLLRAILQSFVSTDNVNDYIQGRRAFASYCLSKTIQNKTIEE